MSKEVSIHEELGITADEAHKLAVAVHRQNPYGSPSEPFAFLGESAPRVFAMCQGHGDRWERLASLITRDDLKHDLPETKQAIEARLANLRARIDELDDGLARMSPEAQGIRFAAEHERSMAMIERSHLENRLTAGLFA